MIGMSKPKIWESNLFLEIISILSDEIEIPKNQTSPYTVDGWISEKLDF